MRSLRRAVRASAGVLVALAVTAACTTTVDGAPEAQRTPTAASSPTTAAPPVRGGLPGFGATKIAFRATHAVVASDDDGCCYGPIVRTDDGVPVPTWNIANSQGDRVTFLVHNFAPGTTEAAATRRVQRDDLPADARAVSTRVIDGDCRFTVYESRTLARTLSTDVFSVRLFSPTPAGAPPAYTPTSVEQAKIFVGDLDICVV